MTLWVMHSPTLEDTIAWPDATLPNISKCQNIAAIKTLLRAQTERITPEELNYKAGRLWKFLRGLQLEDVVVVPQGEQFSIAEITSAIAYMEDAEFPHQRGIRWVVSNVPKSKLGKHQDVLQGTNILYEIGNAQARIAVNNLIPARRSRFAKWKWIIGIIICLKLIIFGFRFLHQEFGPFL